MNITDFSICLAVQLVHKRRRQWHHLLFTRGSENPKGWQVTESCGMQINIKFTDNSDTEDKTPAGSIGVIKLKEVKDIRGSPRMQFLWTDYFIRMFQFPMVFKHVLSSWVLSTHGQLVWSWISWFLHFLLMCFIKAFTQTSSRMQHHVNCEEWRFGCDHIIVGKPIVMYWVFARYRYSIGTYPIHCMPPKFMAFLYF